MEGERERGERGRESSAKRKTIHFGYSYSDERKWIRGVGRHVLSSSKPYYIELFPMYVAIVYVAVVSACYFSHVGRSDGRIKNT